MVGCCDSIAERRADRQPLENVRRPLKFHQNFGPRAARFSRLSGMEIPRRGAFFVGAGSAKGAEHAVERGIADAEP
ncbi:MAG: hypothetical protein QOG67_994, partial [Verrucomicrobiota bacterium]